ncbi:MAG: hypothetical protein ABJA18_13840 [bacterium]
MMKGKLLLLWEKITAKENRDAIARKLHASMLSKIASLVFFVLMISFLVRWFMTATWRDILGYLVVMAIVVLVVFLMIVSPRAERVIQGAFNYNLLFVKWMFISLTPIYFFYLVVAPLVIKAPRGWLRLVAIVGGGILLSAGSFAVITERNRERVLPWLQKRVGKFTPIVYSADLLVMAVSYFSAVTYVLVSSNHLNLTNPQQSTVSAASIPEFYVWHFFQAIPLIKINETLQWQAPLTYKGGAVGLMLLLFQLMVILPVIRAFVWYWKRQEPPAKELRPIHFRMQGMPARGGFISQRHAQRRALVVKSARKHD